MMNGFFTLYKRNFIKYFRNPMWIFLGLMQPMLYLLLYMPILQNIGIDGNSGNTGKIASIFVPGMLVNNVLGGFFTAYGFIDDMRRGIIDRWLVAPISKTTIVVSSIAGHIVNGIVQNLLLIGAGLFFGLNISMSILIVSIFLCSILAVSTIAISHAIAITLKDEGALAAFTNSIYLPLMLLSGSMLPIKMAPEWLQNIASLNPLYYIVEGNRDIFLGNYTSLAVIKAFVIGIGAAAISLFFTVRALRKYVE